MKRTIASVLIAIMSILCIGGGYSESDALNGGIEAEEIILDQLPEPEQESEEDMATGDKLVNLDDLKVAYDKQQGDTNSLNSAFESYNGITNHGISSAYYHTHKYQNAGPEISDSNNYDSLYFIPISEGDIVYYTGSTGTNHTVAILNVYASADASSYLYTIAKADSNTYSNRKFVIGGAEQYGGEPKYLGATFRTAENVPFNLSVGHPYQPQIDNILLKIDAIDDSIEDIDAVIYLKKIVTGTWADGYVQANGNLYTADPGGFEYTLEPIRLKKGQTITFNAQGYSTNVCMIAKYDGSFTGMEVLALSSGNTKIDYTYTALRDIYVVLSGNKSAGHTITISERLDEKVENNTEAIDELKGKTDIDWMLMFHNLGVVGDSLSSGEIAYNDGTDHYIDRYNYSWLSNIARKTGATYKHYSQGGMTAKAWMTSEYKTQLESDTAKSCYFIALGTNDMGQSYPLGNSSDTAGTDSFVGYYKQIINTIHSHAPNAVIFLVSLYTSGITPSSYSEMISTIAGLYSYCYYIDFIGNTDIQNSNPASAYTNLGHFTTLGYIKVADIIHRVVNDVVYNNRNSSFFKFFAVNNANN